MDIDQTLQLLMPLADRHVPVALNLNAQTLLHIVQQTGHRIPKHFAPQAWQAFRQGQSLGWVLTDRVIGKYDLIDFAAAFDPRGVQLGLEIMAYRESHGGEVRQSAWRQQFKGKRGPQSMRFGDDIRNISGATLSCQHVTEGVQRLSALVGTFA
jgi:Na+-translocating ferredoxin:NAD+ oxidoreductase RnfG subunit